MIAKKKKMIIGINNKEMFFLKNFLPINDFFYIVQHE
jgi:hypothetical protein